MVVQSGERVDLPPFSSAKLDKPMMEMVAGSNVWYQAHILQASAAKLRVLFPGAHRRSGIIAFFEAHILRAIPPLPVGTCALPCYCAMQCLIGSVTLFPLLQTVLHYLADA